MTKDYISIDETETEKHRLIKFLIIELKIHGLVDATAYIKEHSVIHENHRHSGFVRSVVYKMESLGVAKVIPQKEWTEFYIKQTVFRKRHPYKYVIILGAIGLIFSVLAGISIAITQATLKSQVSHKHHTEVFSITKVLNDSITILRRDLKIIQDNLKNKNSKPK